MNHAGVVLEADTLISFHAVYAGGKDWAESAEIVSQQISPSTVLERSLLSCGIDNTYLRIQTIAY